MSRITTQALVHALALHFCRMALCPTARTTVRPWQRKLLPHQRKSIRSSTSSAPVLASLPTLPMIYSQPERSGRRIASVVDKNKTAAVGSAAKLVTRTALRRRTASVSRVGCFQRLSRTTFGVGPTFVARLWKPLSVVTMRNSSRAANVQISPSGLLGSSNEAT